MRALGEAALPQVRIYYDASLEYGRNTMPEQGLFYLGAAQAQREVVGFSGRSPRPLPRSPPPLRSLRPELDALEAEMLAAYRPPASIDRHGEFIVASATLKEARELDAAGLRYGALLRYLQAAQRFAPLRPTSQRRLDGRRARGQAAASSKRGSPRAASTTASGGCSWRPRRPISRPRRSRDRLRPPPRRSPPTCCRATSRRSSPARPQAPKPAPQVTVTLVRWPYT